MKEHLNDLLYKCFTVDGNGNIALRMTIESGSVTYWKDPVADFATLPGSGNSNGDTRITLDTFTIYSWNGSIWQASGGGGSVIAGNGISVTGTTVAVDLATNSGLQFSTGKLAVKVDGTTIENTAGTMNVKSGVYALVSHTHVASDITDWTSALNTYLATKTTDNVAQGATNKYYASALFDTDLGTKTTDNLMEGVTNLYYTSARFTTAFGTKTTDNLAEGTTNVYFTTARARTASVVDSTAGTQTDQAPSVASVNTKFSDYTTTASLGTGAFATIANYATVASLGTGAFATIADYQLLLVSGTNIKTINGTTLLGSGDITISGGGLTWGATVNGATGTGLAMTMDNSYSASGIGQSITIGNTQTNALTALSIDTGISGPGNGNTGILIKAIGYAQGQTGLMSGGITINSFSSATQAIADSVGISGGGNFNTNSTKPAYFISYKNENNAGTGSNTGIFIINASTEYAPASSGIGSGITINQTGVGGTAYSLTTGSNINSYINGLVNFTLSNTQSGATIVQKIDTGTSSQGHIGLSITSSNASTSARQILLTTGGSFSGKMIGMNVGDSTTGDLIWAGSATTNGYNGRLIAFELDGTSGKINPSNNSNLVFFNLYQGLTSGNRTADPFYFNMVTHTNIGIGTTTHAYNGLYVNRQDNTGGASRNIVQSGSVAKFNLGWNAYNYATYTSTASILELSTTLSRGWNGSAINSNIALSSAYVFNRTTNVYNLIYDRTNTDTASTVSDSYNMFYIKRAQTQNGAGGTFTSTGSVLKLENVATKTAGTLTDTVTVLNLVQSTISTGDIFSAYSGATKKFSISSTGNVTPVGRLIVPMGQASYFSTTGTAVTISGQSDGSTNMVAVAPTTSLGGMEFEIDNGGGNTGRLRYTGATTKDFHIAITFTGSPATNNDEFVFSVAKNGTVMTGCKIIQKFGTVADSQAIAIHCFDSLATNDYIELYVGNLTGARNITIKSLNVFMMGM